MPFDALRLLLFFFNESLQAIDELLSYGADPSLRLTHGVGTALCVATSTEYEHRRNINTRIQLVRNIYSFLKGRLELIKLENNPEPVYKYVVHFYGDFFQNNYFK